MNRLRLAGVEIGSLGLLFEEQQRVGVGVAEEEQGQGAEVVARPQTGMVLREEESRRDFPIQPAKLRHLTTRQYVLNRSEALTLPLHRRKQHLLESTSLFLGNAKANPETRTPAQIRMVSWQLEHNVHLILI